MDKTVRLVFNDKGIQGQFRTPVREIIAVRPNHSDTTETIHKENGCKFKLDVQKIMFSKGNLEEKRNLNHTACTGETIVDMFAGIGYFSIPIAVHCAPKKIIAIELNPVSYQYLCENCRLNHAETIIEPINGDCQIVTPKNTADRVLMGYVGTTHKYLETAVSALKEKGGILHYHETVPEKLYPARPIERVQQAAKKCSKTAVILEARKVKKYSPGVYHVVVDAEIK
jgi:tRNA wybutosine-synthesizing protein 2